MVTLFGAASIPPGEHRDRINLRGVGDFVAGGTPGAARQHESVRLPGPPKAPLMTGRGVGMTPRYVPPRPIAWMPGLVVTLA
jgi:hypothetical protein